MSVFCLYQALCMNIPIYQGTSGKIVGFGNTKATFVPTNKNLASEIVPNISSAQRDLDAICENIFYLVIQNWLMHTLQSLYTYDMVQYMNRKIQRVMWLRVKSEEIGL